MKKEIWIALSLLLVLSQWWGVLGNEIFPNFPPVKWTEAEEGLTVPELIKTFWKRIQISQNNNHLTNYTANISHSDNYMTWKMPVKLISLQQEHLPQILKLTAFSINQLPAKYEHVNRDESLFPEKWGLSHQSSPLLCCAWCTSRAFSPGSNMDVSICTLLSSPGRRAQQSSLSNMQNRNFFCFLSLISPPILHIPHHSQHSHHLPSRPAGWQQDSVTSILKKLCF